ncbi:MAG: metalloregulator ArsR/SmtB family transcription factor [Acidobacteriota bacterium]
MSHRELPILDHTATLADLTRCRLLLLLDQHELTVSELCTVLQLPQSTVSRHLKVLADGGWVSSRKQGTSHLYRAHAADLPAPELWALVRVEVAEAPPVEQDARRLVSVLTERRQRSQAFFDSAAEQWDSVRSDLFGNRFDLLALLGLLDPRWRIGDLACGTGQVAEALAPFVDRVVAIDDSDAMLASARARLGRWRNVESLHGSLEELPLDDHCLDAAVIVLALHHLADPARALAEAKRVLVPGGRLLVVDMTAHDRESYRQDMGHVWLGFDPSDLDRLFSTGGFATHAVRTLPADPAARGPALFVATATTPSTRDSRTQTTPAVLTANERTATSEGVSP